MQPLALPGSAKTQINKAMFSNILLNLIHDVIPSPVDIIVFN